MTSLWQDLRYGLRVLGKNSSFTVTAILTLALGIGSTTLIFSIIDSVLLHAFPYKNADRLVTFTIVAADEVRAWRFPVGAFVDFKEQNHTFEDMIGLIFREIHYVSRDGTEEFFGELPSRTFCTSRRELSSPPRTLSRRRGRPAASSRS